MTSKLPNNGVEFPTKSCEEIQDYNYISLQITTPSLAEYPCFPVHTKQAAGQSTKQSLQILNIKITKVVSQATTGGTVSRMEGKPQTSHICRNL